MNQQTLQKIYKTYQNQQYYNRYFKQLKLRQDSRQFSQNRDIKITITNGTVAVSKGQTIVITQLSTTVQKVIFNTLDQSYGKPLLSINVKLPSFKGSFTKQNRSSSSVQQFISNKIPWKLIQSQLVIKQTGNKYYAHIGDIQVRIVSNDGSLNQVCLLAVQLLLWLFKFQKIDTQTGQLKSQIFLLELESFYFPCKYCQIMNQILIDPTLTQEENSSYIVSLIGDLLSQKIQENYFLIQKLGKNNDRIPKEIIDSLISMWKVQMSKLTFDIKDLKRRVNSLDNREQTIDLIISQ